MQSVGYFDQHCLMPLHCLCSSTDQRKEGNLIKASFPTNEEKTGNYNQIKPDG